MRSRWTWIGGALLIVLALAAVAIYRSDVPVPEVAELLSEGGEKRLREHLRPPRGAPRVVVFALDGVGADELRMMLRRGYAPELAALLGRASADEAVFAHGYAVPDVLSILPSTTYAAWASLFTGEPAGRTGVPGNEWFAREEVRFYAPAPVSVEGTEQVAEVYSDDLIGQVLRVPTLFERADVRSYVSLASVHRGADLLIIPDLGAVADIAGSLFAGITGDQETEQEVFAEVDRVATESLVETLREHGIPDLQVVYFPGVDLFTHVADPPIPQQALYMREVVDPAIRAILLEYRRQGALDDTYFVIVSDHGHTPVLNDSRHALGAEGSPGPGSVLEQAGFRLRPFELDLDDDHDDFQAVLAYQGAFAYVYLADRSTCPERGRSCDWNRPPRMQEDVMAVAEAFYRASETGTVPELRGTIDLVFAREPRPAGQDARPFQVYDGARLIPISDYLATRPRPDLPDLERRLDGLARGPHGNRAGDVLLLARSGMESPIEERYYFSGEYRSWHGSPSAQDSRIPLLIAHRRSSGVEIRERVTGVVGTAPSQLDVTPLILHLLERGGRTPAPRAGSP